MENNPITDVDVLTVELDVGVIDKSQRSLRKNHSDLALEFVLFAEVLGKKDLVTSFGLVRVWSDVDPDEQLIVHYRCRRKITHGIDDCLLWIVLMMHCQDCHAAVCSCLSSFSAKSRTIRIPSNLPTY